jgi:hypothetical protein
MIGIFLSDLFAELVAFLPPFFVLGFPAAVALMLLAALADVRLPRVPQPAPHR